MTEFPERPDRPEFWKLARIVSAHDTAMDDALTDDHRETIFVRALARWLPMEVATYVSIQRGMRVARVETRGQLLKHHGQVTQLAAAWLDGFAAGAAYVGQAEGGGTVSDQEWDQAGADPDAYPPGIDPYPPEDFGPTDQEPKITDHPFRPHPLQPEVCGYQRRDGWACGHTADEHEHAE